MSAAAPQERPTVQAAQPFLDEVSTPAGLERELRRMAVLHLRAMIRARRGVSPRFRLGGSAKPLTREEPSMKSLVTTR
jgi:hypothetical protein